MSDNKIYWGLESDEVLHYTNKNEAIEMELSGIVELPETIEICCFEKTHKPQPESLAEDIIENTLNDLDYNYELRFDESQDVTEKMRKAALDCAKIFLEEYEVKACTIVKKEIINVKKWISENMEEGWDN